jgi:hypothetical protein
MMHDFYRQEQKDGDMDSQKLHGDTRTEDIKLIDTVKNGLDETRPTHGAVWR